MTENKHSRWRWERGEPIRVPRPELLREMAKHASTTVEKLTAIIEAMRDETTWLNQIYQVHIRKVSAMPSGSADALAFVHLSIKRRDREPVGVEQFRHFQRIKNDLVGPECEAIEIYPAESRLVDTANQYHLWVCTDPTFRWPFGFTERMILAGALQRPFEDDEA